jgi:intracellular sulfur oxidation DsrE/DsrF family protein
MKSILFTFLVVISNWSGSFAQSSKEEHKEKFYFPSSLFNDSFAMQRALPGLYKQVIATLTDHEKNDFENLVNLYLLAPDYSKALAAIDSLQHKKDDYMNDMELKIYAEAMQEDKPGSAGFEQAFNRKFSEVYNQLSFKKKVFMALFDSADLAQFRSDFLATRDKLAKNKSDSLGYDDARSLCDKYGFYALYSRIYPLMAVYTKDPRYQVLYPLIKGYKGAGVAPVQQIDERADSSMRYKLLMELTGFAAKGQLETAKSEVNQGLGEVARKLNLHIMAGVPLKNIDLVVVVHGSALHALLNNEKYKRIYGIDNPNLPVIKQLQAAGTRFIVCGQAMTGFKLEIDDLVPGIKQALTAQTVLSTYQLKGYVLYDISLDN